MKKHKVLYTLFIITVSVFFFPTTEFAWGIPFVDAGPVSIEEVPDVTYDTIQEGINAAADGQTVVVSDGVYSGIGNENISFLGKSITVKSESDDPALCTINCVGILDSKGFIFEGGETDASILSGFTIKSDNSGIHCDNASPTIRNCIINEGNVDNNTGAGITCLNGASPTIEDCTISGKMGEFGGIYCDGSPPSILSCDITGNQKSGGSDGAGGITCVNGSSPTIDNCPPFLQVLRIPPRMSSVS